MPPIPKLNDPSWGTIASPVLAFLARRPAGIKQVLQWARKHRMQYAIARNALSYLSLTGKAYFDDLPGRWKAGCVLAPSSIYSPSAVPSFDDPVDMGRLLRLLDSRSHGVSPSLKIYRLETKIRTPSTNAKPNTIRTITLGDRTMTVTQWSRETGLSPNAIHGRLSRGWPADKILSEPIHSQCWHSIAKQPAR